MKTIQNLLLAAFLLTSFGVMEAGAAPEQDGGLPALINEKEKGVFHLRVLNKQGQEISSGTGFLVDGKGTLVTALHVILPKRDVVGEVEALDADGKTWKVEGVTASDSSVDLAVLKLEKVPDAAPPAAWQATVCRNREPRSWCSATRRVSSSLRRMAS